MPLVQKTSKRSTQQIDFHRRGGAHQGQQEEEDANENSRQGGETAEKGRGPRLEAALRAARPRKTSAGARACSKRSK